MQNKFMGFGFGAIQGGLFLLEAFESGNFDALTVAEVVPEVVQSLRDARGVFQVNVAMPDAAIVRRRVEGVSVWNPRAAGDRAQLVAAAARADELATALPSVQFYGDGEPGSVVDILAAGLRQRDAGHPCIVYTAENHNHAAEILRAKVARQAGMSADELERRMQFLNTVIGKMSGVVTDEDQIREQQLARLTGDGGRCLLVEAFNRILITRIRLPDFRRGIGVFAEKPDLLPFEEAKLFGHNATHALLGYIARLRGIRFMADVSSDRRLTDLARAAFIEESGAALCRRHAGVDALFTEGGYRAYVEDLLVRMMNPALRDAVERVVRDPRRKLGWDDRLVGTMRMALSAGIEPLRYALGAAAARRMLAQEGHADAELRGWWRENGADDREAGEIMQRIIDADQRLQELVGG